MPKRKRKDLELENGGRLKKLKTHEKDNGKLISKQSLANSVAVQPKSNGQIRKMIYKRHKHQAPPRPAKTERRRVRRENEKKLAVEAQNFDEETADVQGSQKKSKKITKEPKKPVEASWKLSEIAGGRMLDLDPIFAFNEEYCQLRSRMFNAHTLILFFCRYLLIPYDIAVNVYATSTSLLVRRLRLSSLDRVSGFALSPTSTSHLFVSTSSGSIEKWDWLEGSMLEYWNVFATIYSLATSMPVHAETNNCLVYTVDRKDEGQWRLTVHRLLGGSEASKTDLGTLLKYPEPLTFVKILDNGRIIVVTSGSRVIIGTCDRPNPDSLKDLSYVWREVECPEWITCIDVQTRLYDKNTKRPKQSKNASHGAVDIVVGTLRGKIIIYDDLLENLNRIERGAKTRKVDGVSSRRLHWHRSAVLALKWSMDGI